jgi:hypothetical protein
MYLARLLLAIFLFGVLGTAAELLLLGHFEDIQQFIPLVLIAIGVVAVVWFAKWPSPASLTVFRTTLVLFAVSGLLGIYFHYSGNVEFEREREEALGGLRLFWEAMTGATPALAPGSMVLLAAIGYAALRASERRSA